MSHIYKHVPGIGVPAPDENNSDAPGRPTTLRDRWESIRYGPAGRVLGYGLTFTLIFVLIFLLLWFLERGHF